MHAVPEKQKISRIARIKKSGETAALVSPPILGCGYLIEWVFEVGPVNSGGMGQAPITWTDIKHWSDLTGVKVSGWEAGVMKQMSSAYLSEYQQAKDPYRQAPGSEEAEITEEKRDKVSSQIRAFVKNRKKG